MTRIFPPIAKSSDARHLRHWGVLVTHLCVADATSLLSRVVPYGEVDATDLGAIYEIFRGEDGRHDGQVNAVTFQTLRDQWPTFSTQYVGETNCKHPEIKEEGTYPERN